MWFSFIIIFIISTILTIKVDLFNLDAALVDAVGGPVVVLDFARRNFSHLTTTNNQSARPFTENSMGFLDDFYIRFLNGNGILTMSMDFPMDSHLTHLDLDHPKPTTTCSSVLDQRPGNPLIIITSQRRTSCWTGNMSHKTTKAWTLII